MGCLSGTLTFWDLSHFEAIFQQMALLTKVPLRSVKVKESQFPSRSVNECSIKECLLYMFQYGVLNYVPLRNVKYMFQYGVLKYVPSGNVF